MNKKRIAVFAASLLMLTVFVSVIAFRPDLRFLITDSLYRAFSNVKLEKIDASALEYEEYAEDVPSVDQSLMLINSEYPLDADFSAKICEYKDSTLYFNECMTDAYASLSFDVKEKFGKKLYVMSAYRTEEEQLDAIEAEGENAAAVGESEHQSGLALDVYVSMYAGAGFLKSDVGRYVNSNSWRYGFIIRYPYYAEDKTKMAYEPWHIRYVGSPHAEIIYKNSLSLEEYIASFDVGEYYGYGEYIITRQSALPDRGIKGYDAVSVSSDNTGYYMITYERQ